MTTLATWFGASIAAAALPFPAAARANASAPPDGARRANVLLVTVDTLCPDHCSVHGYGRETTSALERLAGEGVLFETAYTPTPTTAPSHASLFTSCYPARHGVLKNGPVPAAHSTDLEPRPPGLGVRRRLGLARRQWALLRGTAPVLTPDEAHPGSLPEPPAGTADAAGLAREAGT